MMIDAFLPEGLTQLAVDSIFMAPQLGVLSTVHEQAATEVFERDCLIRLGAVLAPVGAGRPGQPCVTVEVASTGMAVVDRKVAFGELALLPLPKEGTARITVAPERGFDVGAGRGRMLTAEIPGGRAARAHREAAPVERGARPLPERGLTWRTPIRRGCA
jgi:hypothetical protein